MNITTFVEYLAYFHLAVFIFGILFLIYTFAKGITPAIWRLGNGLARRKIAIFAKGDNAVSLRDLLVDSKLLSAKNIIQITKLEDAGRAEPATVYLVFWHDWETDIDEILKQKPDECALIVYAPYDRDRIPTDQMKKLDGKRHTAVTNFRGRLLNDIVSSMITTSYEES
jgi:hypothetical protein